MAAPQSSAALPHSRLNTAPRAEALPTSPDAFHWQGRERPDAAMRAAQPDQAFPGYTDTAELAAAVYGIVGGDAANGARRDLTEA